jgi:hypothetical protein
LVEVKGGLHADLDQAIGTNSAGDRSVGDRIRILAGEGSTDYVYLGHVGRFGQVPGGTGDVIAFVGHSMDSGDPSRPPDPDYAPARALFDALANGPRTGDDQFGTRTSPGGRVTCEVGVGSPYEASCRITGAIETFFR